MKILTARTINDITKRNLSQVPRSRGSSKIEYIVIHYLGVPNADNPDLYGGGYGGHYNIKRDGSVYKAADPKTAVVWHCGGGLQGSGGHSFYGKCTNYNSIGIECGVCYTDTAAKDGDGDSDKWYFTEETQESLVWLVSKLMDEYGIGIDHVIRHYDVTGKSCPNPYVKNNKVRTSWTWDEFKSHLAEYRKNGGYTPGTAAPQEETRYYRVRTTWENAASQIGAYTVLENARQNCPAGYAVFDWNGKEVYRPDEKSAGGLQAKSLKGIGEAAVVAKIGPLCTADMAKSGILASVTAAQFILESGYGQTELAQNANNCFGMKKSLSGNTWGSSTWDGKSIYTKKTQEDDGSGNLYTIEADFRKYPCIEDSIGDHSAYLLGAKNGSALRYEGLQSEKDYRKAITIIKNGGYATDTKYVAKICDIIERWNLTALDTAEVKSQTLSKKKGKASGGTISKAKSSSKFTVTGSGTPNETEVFVDKVTANMLNVRSWAGTNNPNIRSYPMAANGNLISVCDSILANDKSEWYYVKIAGKYFGFVSAKYIARA